MNHVYRILWNDTLCAFVAVAENASGRGKRSLGKKARAALAAGLVAGSALAGPTGGQISAGQGGIQQAGPVTTIRQDSARLAINWNSFNIGSNETVNFVQPGAGAIALNRVLGTEGSQILGSLNANGQVFILNPNGVLFGRSAQVNVGGLLASTLGMSDADFLAGRHVLQGAGGLVRNEGSLRAGPGGYIALVGGQIANSGTIVAQQGSVALAAGNKVTLDFAGDGLLRLAVDEGALNAQVANGGLVQADGGAVLLTAKAADQLVASVVNNTGIIQARTLQNRAGRIVLLGDMDSGTTRVAGTLDASAPEGGDGGFIETSAAHVKVAPGARITTQAPQGKTGKWLIDPQDYTIAASGGDITGADLSAQLATTDVEIQSVNGGQAGNGDIHVNDNVSWSANQLTLTAERDININAVMSASGSSSLVMNTGTAVAGGTVKVGMAPNAGGFTGRVDFDRSGTGFLTINGRGYTVINSLGAEGSTSGTDLQGMNGNLNGFYALGADIDASPTAGWNSSAGFAPIGTLLVSFRGGFNGLGHTISGLTISRSSEDSVGLFGATSGAAIRNVGLAGGSVNGHTHVGGLVGHSTGGGAISNSYATGSVSGMDFSYLGGAGGLVGTLESNAISNSYATGSVNGGNHVGGLVGYSFGGGAISNSYATGSISSNGVVIGGLVGNLEDGAISNSYAIGSVNGAAAFAGGLVGSSFRGAISNSYATGSVNGGGYVGGLVGHSAGGGISNSYATGSVSSDDNIVGGVGGLVGRLEEGGAISSSYATGSVSGRNKVGGLVGYSAGGSAIADSYANGSVSGGIDGIDGVGGLVGRLEGGGGISNSYATGSVNGMELVGGLVGYSAGGGAISNSYATGSVSGNSYVGGLVGYSFSGAISNSYATGSVSGVGDDIGMVGGLVGNLESSAISNSYATGSVSGNSYIGGLVGYSLRGAISNSYANGSVSGRNYVGGLVGYSDSGCTISNSYATGSVTGNSSMGGLVGENGGTVTDSYWDMQTSGQSNSAAGTGLTTAQMRQLASFTGWDIGGAGGGTSVWRIYEGHTAPLLRSFLTPLTVTADNVTKTYDGTSAGLTNVAYSDSAASGSSNLFGVATPYGTVTKNNVGTYAADLWSRQIDPSSGLPGYDITVVGGGLTVTPATVSVSGVTAGNKVYDGTTAATLNTAGATLSGLFGSDAVLVDASGITGSFANKNAGTGKTVNLAGGSLSGVDAGNYVLGPVSGTTTADITPAALTVSGLVADNKTYNGNTAATVNVTGAVYAGMVSGDVVTVSATGTFGDKNVGNAKTVTLSSSYSGVDTGNYTITDQATTSADITPAALTVSGLVADNKTYNGDTVATVNVTGAVYAGLIGGDAVTVSATGTFSDKNVATGKTVTLSSSYSGADTGNYTITDQATSSANITPAALTVSGLVANNKVYDGNTAATVNVSGAVYAGLVSGDVVTVSATGTFGDKNVGNGKTVTLSSSYSGADAGNYTITDQATTTADITPKALTVSGITASNKVYDQTASATINTGGAVYSGLISGDAVTVSATGTFGDKNVGNAKTVTLSSSYSGADAGNYTITDQATSSADITPAALTVSGLVADNKTYNGDTAATVNVSGAVYTGLIGGDAVTVSATGTFGDKNVGNGKTVTLSSSYSGADTGNYTITDQATSSANITPAPLTVSGITASNKVYDQTASATINTGGAVYAGLIGGDAVTVSATGTFSDKNAANGKTVTLSSTYAGADLGNYSITDQATTTADITPKALTVSGITASNKVYDGGTAATVNVSGAVYTGLVGGDAVTVSATGTFGDKNVATGKTVTLSSSYSGADTGNYTITDQATSSADITPAALTVSGITASNKVYDGGTAATVNVSGAVYAGLVDGDAVTVSATGTFSDKNVANGKTVTLSSTYSGADLGNYSITGQATTTADITPKALTVSGITASNKVYDQTASATINTGGAVYGGLILGDAVTVSATGTFSDKNAANGKTVTLSSTYSGADLGNYSITDQATTTADITSKALTVSGITASNKVYDGSTTATVSTAGAVYTGLVGGDAVTVSATGTFSDKNVANGKTVTLSSSYSGADTGNYAITDQATSSADITPAALMVSGITAADKVYNASTVATLAGTGAVTALGSDVVWVTGNGVGAFADRNVGAGKAVTVTGYTLTGTDAANYSIVQPTGVTASITQASLEVSGITAANKIYDGGTAATLGGTASVTAFGSDVVNVVAGSGAFADKNVGRAKTVIASGFSLGGVDAANYTVVQPTGITADITPAPLAISADDKVKDIGTPDPLFTFRTGTLAAGDTLANAFIGALSRVGGQGIGSYAINQGTLAAVGGNYMLMFTPGTLEVRHTPPPAAGAASAALAAMHRAAGDSAANAGNPVSGGQRRGNGGVGGPSDIDDAAGSGNQLMRVVDGGIRMP